MCSVCGPRGWQLRRSARDRAQPKIDYRNLTASLGPTNTPPAAAIFARILPRSGFPRFSLNELFGGAMPSLRSNGRAVACAP